MIWPNDNRARLWEGFCFSNTDGMVRLLLEFLGKDMSPECRAQLEWKCRLAMIAYAGEFGPWLPDWCAGCLAAVQKWTVAPTFASIQELRNTYFDRMSGFGMADEPTISQIGVQVCAWTLRQSISDAIVGMSRHVSLSRHLKSISLKESAARSLKEVFGNPFRKEEFPLRSKDGSLSVWWDLRGGRFSTSADLPQVNIYCPWITRDLADMAEAIHQEERWQDIPILMDVLEEIGVPEQETCRLCKGTGLICKPGDMQVVCEPCLGSGHSERHWVTHLRDGTIKHTRGCWVVDMLRSWRPQDG